MADSPAHKLGNMIGQILEEAMEPVLRKVASENNLYLDKDGKKPRRNNNKKLRWKDLYGNDHLLDYVIEKGGTDETIGKPVAFIECAWRSYTKHSKNKAQEIQGAIMPLCDTFFKSWKFIGVVLAGDFTETSLSQLKSRGFVVLHFSRDEMIKAFAKAGSNIDFNEKTLDPEILAKIEQLEGLKEAKKNEIKTSIIEDNKEKVDTFTKALNHSLNRVITSIHILPLHGNINITNGIDEAIKYITNYNESESVEEFVKYEIIVKYNNGDKVEATFSDKSSAISFLHIMKAIT